MASAVVSIVLFLLAIAGAINSGLILKEPDICFLLAVGRWIVEHGSIPQSDPFSWGYLLADPGRPYVIYQWLSECCFYLVEKYFTAAGLLVVSAVLTAHAFFVVPLQMLRLATKPAVSLVVSFWTLTVVLCHVSIRPELFTYLFTALFLKSLFDLYESRRVDVSWSFVGICCVISALWVNLHCLFILMPLMLAGCLLIAFAEMLIMKSQGAQTHAFEAKTLAIALVGCLAATLLNPYFFSIYPVVFHILTDPINETILELKPLTLDSLKSPFLYPFLTFSLFTAFQFLKENRFLFRSGGAQQFLRKFQYGDLLFRALLLVGTVAGYRSVRMVPLSALFAVAGIAYLWSRRTRKDLATPFNEAIGRLIFGDGLKLEQALLVRLGFPIIYLCMAGLGAGLMVRIVPPELPQGSAAFQPPIKAIEYLRTMPFHPQKLLNDPHFGVVMMWHMEKPPKVFIDARYYMYSKAWIDDYWEMIECRSRWKELLAKYEIDCVFVKTKDPIARTLASERNWKKVYEDETATILSRVDLEPQARTYNSSPHVDCGLSERYSSQSKRREICFGAAMF